MSSRPASCVLITRPEPGAGRTAARVAALGLVPIVTPVLQIRALPVNLPPAAAVAAILVTSGNAIAALPAASHATLLLTVGNATAGQARDAGFTDVRSADGDAEALAALAARECRPRDGPLLLACGRGQGEPLAARLRDAGFHVIRRAVYAALPARRLNPEAIDALYAGHVRAVLVFSAESARQFVRLAQRAEVAEMLARVDAISIGHPAAVALGALPWRSIRVAARPTHDEMLALLQ